MVLGHLPDERQEVRREQGQRHAGALGGRPQPVQGAVGRPALLVRLQEHEAQPEHARLARPALDEAAALRPVERELAEDREPVGLLAGGLQRETVRARVPSRRVDHRRGDARGIHLREQLVLGENRDRTMGRQRRTTAQMCTWASTISTA